MMIGFKVYLGICDRAVKSIEIHFVRLQFELYSCNSFFVNKNIMFIAFVV